MQVRLDRDIAAYIRKDTDAHRRIFKRRKSYAQSVNEKLRDLMADAVYEPKFNDQLKPAKLTP